MNDSPADKTIKLFVYPVADLAQARTLFSKLLGVEPYADQAYYVGLRVGDQEIGLDPNGHKQGRTAPIRRSLQELLDAGARLRQDVRDVGGRRTALVVDWPNQTTGQCTAHRGGDQTGSGSRP